MWKYFHSSLLLIFRVYQHFKTTGTLYWLLLVMNRLSYKHQVQWKIIMMSKIIRYDCKLQWSSSSIQLQIIFSISRLVCKMSKIEIKLKNVSYKSTGWPLLGCLVLSDQQSKTTRKSVYFHRRARHCLNQNVSFTDCLSSAPHNQENAMKVFHQIIKWMRSCELKVNCRTSPLSWSTSLVVHLYTTYRVTVVVLFPHVDTEVNQSQEPVNIEAHFSSHF